MAVWSEVRLSNIQYTRFDGEYYSPKYLVEDEMWKKLSDRYRVEKLSRLIKAPVKMGRTPSNRFIGSTDNKVHFIKTNTLREGRIDYQNCDYLPERTLNSSDYIKDECVVVTIIGATPEIVGRTAIIRDVDPIRVTNQNVAVIDTSKDLNAYYLTAYFQTKYGRDQLWRHSRRTEQVNLNCREVERVLVPNVSSEIQNQIGNMVKRSFSLLDESKSIYAKAQDLLEKELGLDQLELENSKSYEASFSEVMEFQRMDADYYKPIYQGIEKKFNNFKRIKIRDIVNYPVSSGSTPKSGGNAYTNKDFGIPFIRVVDFKDNEVDEKNFNYIKNNIHEKLLKKTKLHKNDILFSIAGTVGRCVIFNHDFEANINQAVSIIRFDESIIKRLYLVAFFNSKVGKLYVKKFARQGVQTNLTLKEVSNLSIPILDMDKQGNIVQLIEKSMESQKKSEQLLEQAKKRVENLIEGVTEP